MDGRRVSHEDIESVESGRLLQIERKADYGETQIVTGYDSALLMM